MIHKWILTTGRILLICIKNPNKDAQLNNETLLKKQRKQNDLHSAVNEIRSEFNIIPFKL